MGGMAPETPVPEAQRSPGPSLAKHPLAHPLSTVHPLKACHQQPTTSSTTRPKNPGQILHLTDPATNPSTHRVLASLYCLPSHRLPF